MGFAIKISAYGEWERTYFVQGYDESEAKLKAFRMFKGTMTCYLPETIKEAEENEGFYIEVLAEIEQIIL